MIIAAATDTTCLQFPALGMVEDGYDVYGVIDASGAESPMADGLGGCGGHSRHARGEGEDLSLPASVEPDWAVAVHAFLSERATISSSSILSSPSCGLCSAG